MEPLNSLRIAAIEIPNADAVTQLPGPLRTTALQVHAESRYLGTDAGRVYVVKEACIMDMRNVSHSVGPRVADLTAIQAGDQLLFNRLSTCPDGNAAFAAAVVLIMPPQN
ncbi:hypothetical protein [Desulfatitalea alkaliphila]|uniref:Uncharacterized protein n=1 Tax=Desulfatitalea alkaliphila TaxID=2929485 RepID=A0AA41R6L5_9BACT|nr:hypothetical protein [Desulfatitalea alkaliphila]MCJ8500033.1 hypothetical protein [Desulfatitalea alkaliphila]